MARYGLLPVPGPRKKLHLRTKTAAVRPAISLACAPPCDLALASLFDERVRHCRSSSDLRSLLKITTRALGFDHFALLHHGASSVRKGSRLCYDNYPRDWAREHEEQRLAHADPVHQASRRSNAGFVWSRLDQIVRLDREQRDILARAHQHGLGDGFTVPANVPGEPSGSCSFAMHAGRPLPLSSLACAELIGSHAFAAARRIHALPARMPPRLSRRGLDCLRLLACGKTDWEISRILGISIETVHQYVKSARAAYDVSSRTQLVVHGLRDALISFDEAIPPPG